MTFLEPPPFNDNILSDLKIEGKFRDIIEREYSYEANMGGLDVKLSVKILHDAHQNYLKDIALLGKNLKTLPDYFKHAGCLAYWLHYYQPIREWSGGDIVLSSKSRKQKAREFLLDYGHDYLAFCLGFKICSFFEKYGCDIDINYIESICYVIKNKSISPHAMMMVYRSLFYK